MTTKRVFITGLEGFTGKYFSQELLNYGYEIFGTVHQSSLEKSSSIFACNLQDTERLSSLLKRVQPNYVVNLAGISFIGHGCKQEIYEANQLGVLSLLSAIDQSAIIPTKVILAGSAHVYGAQTKSPISETFIPQPNTDYGISKYAMEKIASLWFDHFPIVITRPFNYTGIGQSKVFLLPKIVNHFVKKMTTIELGNIDISRDWSDVRDVVTIYRNILESEIASTIVNVCSGISYPISYILESMIQISGQDIDVRHQRNLMRSNEIKELWGDNTLLRTYLGDFKIRPLYETLEWMFTEKD